MGIGMQPPTATTTGFPDDTPDFQASLSMTHRGTVLSGEIALWKANIMVGQVEQGGFVVLQVTSPARESFTEILAERLSAHFTVSREVPPGIAVREPETTLFLMPDESIDENAQQLFDRATRWVLERERTSAPRAHAAKSHEHESRIEEFIARAGAALERELGVPVTKDLVAALYRVASAIGDREGKIGLQPAKEADRDFAVQRGLDALLRLLPHPEDFKLLSAGARAHVTHAIENAIRSREAGNAGPRQA